MRIFHSSVESWEKLSKLPRLYCAETEEGAKARASEIMMMRRAKEHGFYLYELQTDAETTYAEKQPYRGSAAEREGIEYLPYEVVPFGSIAQIAGAVNYCVWPGCLRVVSVRQMLVTNTSPHTKNYIEVKDLTYTEI